MVSDPGIFLVENPRIFRKLPESPRHANNHCHPIGPRRPVGSRLDKCAVASQTEAMAMESGSPFDSLWQEYARVFLDWDDLTLGRWLVQTLGQFSGRAWRSSHPLVGSYMLAAKVAHDRQIWLKRMASAPANYGDSNCCRAPFLPLITRDVRQDGLLCQHCSETLVPFDEIPEEFRRMLEAWARSYESVHAVAHWDDRQRKTCGNFDEAYEDAANQAESHLRRLGGELAPKFLDHYAAVVWVDQDECLEVRPEDVAPL